MSSKTDPLTYYGRNVIQDYQTHLRAKLSLESGQSHSLDVSDNQLRLLPKQKVGILGAGIGGLYAALILDSLDIEYEILEASNRTGGRIFTYKFPSGDKYDYYVCFPVCPRHPSDADLSRLPRMRVPCVSHFRRRIAKDDTRMAS